MFEISGCGWISYKFGGGNASCYIQVIDAVTHEILARYGQQAFNEAVLIQYVANLSAYAGRLDRMVKKLNDKGVEDTPHDDKEW